jgi:hypothetical protein
MYVSDHLNGVVVSNADCYSKGFGIESRVSHGTFQIVQHWIDNPALYKINHVSNDLYAELKKSSAYFAYMVRP